MVQTLLVEGQGEFVDATHLSVQSYTSSSQDDTTSATDCKPRSVPLLALEPVAREFEGATVLRDRTDDIVRDTSRDLCVDLKRHPHRGADEPDEMRDDLIGACCPPELLEGFEEERLDVVRLQTAGLGALHLRAHTG